MIKKTFPKVLELDYDKWVCGDDFVKDGKYSSGYGVTQLLNANGYMCCLGQFCEQAGIPKSCLLFLCDGSDIVAHTTYKVTTIDSTKFEQYAISINDNQKTTIVEKVKALKKLCSKYKRKLVLKNFPEGMLDDKS